MPFRSLKYYYIRRKRKHRYVPVTPPYSHCKNCGHELTGMYCSVCGQYAHMENRPFGESLMLYLEHHYALDHKLGSSLFNLFFKPGMLAKEYMKGRIESHVHPFKLYFFSSLLLFGLVIGLSKSEMISHEGEKPIMDTTSNPTNRMLVNRLTDSLKTHKKDLTKSQVVAIRNSIDSLEENINEVDVGMGDGSVSFEKKVESALTKMSKNELYEKFFHYLSLSILVLMPIFALLLLLFYRKKQKYYTAHVVHSIHIHVTLFLLVSLSILWDHFFPNVFSIGGWLMLAWLIYFVLSLSRFYGEKKRKSVLKGGFILFIYFFIAIFAVVGVSIASIVY